MEVWRCRGVCQLHSRRQRQRSGSGHWVDGGDYCGTARDPPRLPFGEHLGTIAEGEGTRPDDMSIVLQVSGLEEIQTLSRRPSRLLRTAPVGTAGRLRCSGQTFEGKTGGSGGAVALAGLAAPVAVSGSSSFVDNVAASGSGGGGVVLGPGSLGTVRVRVAE